MRELSWPSELDPHDRARGRASGRSLRRGDVQQTVLARRARGQRPAVGRDGRRPGGRGSRRVAVQRDARLRAPGAGSAHARATRGVWRWRKRRLRADVARRGREPRRSCSTSPRSPAGHHARAPRTQHVLGAAGSARAASRRPSSRSRSATRTARRHAAFVVACGVLANVTSTARGSAELRFCAGGRRAQASVHADDASATSIWVSSAGLPSSPGGRTRRGEPRRPTSSCTLAQLVLAGDDGDGALPRRLAPARAFPGASTSRSSRSARAGPHPRGAGTRVAARGAWTVRRLALAVRPVRPRRRALGVGTDEGDTLAAALNRPRSAPTGRSGSRSRCAPTSASSGSRSVRPRTSAGARTCSSSACTSRPPGSSTSSASSATRSAAARACTTSTARSSA